MVFSRISLRELLQQKKGGLRIFFPARQHPLELLWSCSSLGHGFGIFMKSLLVWKPHLRAYGGNDGSLKSTYIEVDQSISKDLTAEMIICCLL